MGLELYNKKRNFKETPEPSGRLANSVSKLVFVVQRHKASHLHYDLRLEMDGVLKSWAVPKGPSLNSKDKRLAMMVEDHPYSYRNFEGIIPEGNYGAGIVEVWDTGSMSDLDNSDTKTSQKKLKAGLKAGNLKFVLHGKKLKGEFALVKLKDKQENVWLLIKHRDKFSVEEEYSSEAYTGKNSPINKWLQQNKKPLTTKIAYKTKSAAAPKNKEKEEPPFKKKVRALPGKTRKLGKFVHPMLAKESASAFSDKEWIYEIKWDGYRAIAEVNKKNVSLYSRNGNTFDGLYPIVAEGLRKMNLHAVLDGEIVVLNEEGDPDFQLLQHYQTDSEHPILFYVFDVLEINGTNTCGLPLTERKSLLKKLLKKNEVVRYSDHIEERGEDFFSIAKERNLEGIMAKRADSEYHPGSRTNDWLKIKNHLSQEAIIAGFTEPGGGRKHFGALVLGIKEGNGLRYIGHTGTGFDDATLKKMSALLKRLIQKKSPFKETVKTNMPATWVKPVLVCEVKYTEATRAGHLRHPVFVRLREDKTAKEVSMHATKKIAKKSAKKTSKTSDVKKQVLAKSKNTVAKKADSKAGSTKKIGRIAVPVTNLSKIFWPKEKITKGDVIDYYQSISDYIMPYLVARPESLLRNPNGIDKPGFFHKDAGDKAPEWVERIPLFSESANKNIDYILCNNKATLAYMNNLGCIEINPWHSTVKALDKPDYIIIDLDPSEKNTFDQVVETANVVKQVLDKAGADSYCKTSGATGLHIYIPVQKKYTYDQVKDFAQLICIFTQELVPEFTSMERNLKKRGNNKIYLDYLQNRRGQTIACAYSLRPKEGATVSMPILWKEVKKGLSPQHFNIHNALQRLQKNGDIFKNILGKGIDISECLKNLENYKAK